MLSVKLAAPGSIEFLFSSFFLAFIQFFSVFFIIINNEEKTLNN